MLAGIKKILIISTSKDITGMIDLFGSGAKLGLSISYAVQEEPRGVPEAFLIGEKFIGKDNVCLILGDNIFCGEEFVSVLKRAKEVKVGATVFGYSVKDPERFGVVNVDKNNNPVGIEEKPANPKSNYAVTGLYFYDNQVVDIVKNLGNRPFNICSVNQEYLNRGKLRLELFGRGFAWFDVGTNKSLFDASNYIQTLESVQGLSIGSVEEIAYRKGFINKEKFKYLVNKIKHSQYGMYLKEVVKK